MSRASQWAGWQKGKEALSLCGPSSSPRGLPSPFLDPCSELFPLATPTSHCQPVLPFPRVLPCDRTRTRPSRSYATSYNEYFNNSHSRIARSGPPCTPSMATTDPAGVDRSRPLFSKLNTSKKKVAYFYDSDIGNYAYVTGHPMKPHRIRLAHSLVMNYNVYKYLEVYVSYQPSPAPGSSPRTSDSAFKGRILTHSLDSVRSRRSSTR